MCVCVVQEWSQCPGGWGGLNVSFSNNGNRWKGQPKSPDHTKGVCVWMCDSYSYLPCEKLCVCVCVHACLSVAAKRDVDHAQGRNWFSGKGEEMRRKRKMAEGRDLWEEQEEGKEGRMNGGVEVKRKNNRGTCRRRRIKSEGKAKEKSERNKEERKVCNGYVKLKWEKIKKGFLSV